MTCEIPGCSKKYYGNGMCSMHATRMRDHGSLERQPCKWCGSTSHSIGEIGACAATDKKLAKPHPQEMRIWRTMKARCFNKRSRSYPMYGARGITICERWMKFENFYADMGPRPSDLHSIDRIDNSGIYEPSNCRWATQKEQCRNTSKNILVEYNGEKMTLAEASERSGILYGTLQTRHYKGIRDPKKLFAKELRDTRVKLNHESAAVIRDRMKSGESVHVIAAEYGVSKYTIYDVSNGRRWALAP